MNLSTKFLLLWLRWILAVNQSYLSSALKDVRVTIPTAVKSGDNALLMCHYDLEQDTLYSIKWYKGNREFYRYTPRENTPRKVFGSVSGIKVQLALSNSSAVLLTAVKPANSGKYSCEVSADAPSFHTVIVSADLQVVDVPKSGPTINCVERVYSFGDILTANCTLSSRRPLANLTWLINNYTAHSQQIVQFNSSKDDLSNQETSAVGLKLVLQPKHFRSKHLTLTCRANIYDMYEIATEKLIELDATSNQILADDFNTFGSSSRHMSAYDDDEDDFLGLPGPGNDIRMHHIKAPDMSSKSDRMSPSKILVALALSIPIAITSIFQFVVQTTSSTTTHQVTIRHLLNLTGALARIKSESSIDNYFIIGKTAAIFGHRLHRQRSSTGRRISSSCSKFKFAFPFPFPEQKLKPDA